MPAFSFKKARECGAINDKELERFGVLFMLCQDRFKITSKDWEQAATEFGGTAGSFNFAYRQAIKKLKDKNCYVDGEEQGLDIEADSKTAPSKKSAPKKRKAIEQSEDKQTAEPATKKNNGSKKDGGQDGRI